MPATVARPPASISLAELFTTWLPQTFAQARAGGATPPDVTIAVTLTGDGGGAWTLRVAGGALTVDDGADARAPMALAQSAADFRAALWGEGGRPSMVPPQMDLTAVVPGQVKVPTAALALVQGTLRVEIPKFAGRTWAADITLGGAASPSATVSADLETLEELRSGALAPANAFFSGKIAISGDVPWLMQVGMGFASNLGN
jgi:hypothetical protein